MQQIFDKVIAQQNLDTLYTLGLILLGVSLFQGLISAVRTYLFADTTNRIDIALGAQVIQHLLRPSVISTEDQLVSCKLVLLNLVISVGF